MLIRVIAGLLVVIGAAGFTLPFWIRNVVKAPTDLEFPLVEIEDIAVTNGGELIFALMSAGQIQKYTNNGEFIASYPGNFYGGAFCIEINGDRLTAYVARRDEADEFDLNGHALRLNTPITDQQYRAACSYDDRVRSIAQALEGLVVTFRDGKPPLTIKRRPWHYLAFGPFGSWLIFVIGLVLFPEWRRGILRQIRERRRK